MEDKEPLYHWLVNTLKEQIDHEYKPHQKMASERNLAIIYHVSRTTVRAALKQLEMEGYIYKRHGKGTFVSQESDRMTNLSKMYSFTEQMILLNKVPKTIVLDFEIIKPAEVISKQMGLDNTQLVYQITRLRLANDVPMMLEVTYMPVHLFENLTREMVEQQPLYTIVSEGYHEIIQLAKEKFFAGVATKQDAIYLGIAENSPVFQIQRQTFNDKNDMIELTDSIARGDKFRYQIHHQRMINKIKED